VVQEGLHSIKTKNMQSIIVKIDLSKAYERVSWIYLRVMLLHIGFNVPFINWVMSCINTMSFALLINVSASKFFRPKRGLS
jgi:hypothetical protein